MFETVINLKPEDSWPQGMTVDKLIAVMNQALQFPGVSNAWTMPIKGRTDMLSTGIRTPVGVKLYGNDLGELDRLSKQIESVVARCRAPPAPSPSACWVAITSILSRTVLRLPVTA